MSVLIWMVSEERLTSFFKKIKYSRRFGNFFIRISRQSYGGEKMHTCRFCRLCRRIVAKHSLQRRNWSYHWLRRLLCAPSPSTARQIRKAHQLQKILHTIWKHHLGETCGFRVPRRSPLSWWLRAMLRWSVALTRNPRSSKQENSSKIDLQNS